MSQDLADIVPTGAENGEEGIAFHSFQAASGEAPVGFHVANFSFDGASASEISDQPGRQACICGQITKTRTSASDDNEILIL